MMKREVLRDRLLQAVGLLILAGLTAAFIFAFRKNLLPQQEEGDVFATVYAISAENEPEIDPEEDLSDLSSEAEGR